MIEALILRKPRSLLQFRVVQIHEGGSFAEVEFTAMGSGSLAALSVLEVHTNLVLNHSTNHEHLTLALEYTAGHVVLVSNMEYARRDTEGNEEIGVCTLRNSAWKIVWS